MSVELDNLKVLIASLEDAESMNIKYEYSPVNPCGIVGVKMCFGTTIYLTKRDDEQVTKPG